MSDNKDSGEGKALIYSAAIIISVVICAATILEALGLHKAAEPLWIILGCIGVLIFWFLMLV